REFSAEEGKVGLSAFLWDALALKTGEEGAAVTIQTKSLEKGTYVRLRPLEITEEDLDWKHVLELYMRNFSTLTVNQVLVVPAGHGARRSEVRFLVDKLEPEDAVLTVDTDLEVDIEALNEDMARESVKRQMARARESERTAGQVNGEKAQGGIVMLGKKVEGEVRPGEYVDFELKGWNKNLPVNIELGNGEDEDGEVDVFASTT